MQEGDGLVARIGGLIHRYGDTIAVDNIDLDIPVGGMVGVIGPDGVGKSSLLALIAGARKIQKGSVEVFGGDMRNSHYRTKISSRIAYMPQGLGKNLYATLSVFENIDFFGRLFGQGRGERERRIHDLLKSTGLSRFRDRPAGKLSGGMKQKLGLCCALIHDPDLLILDEPTTGVDPLSRREFWELINRIRARRPGMSVIVATSYIEEAERFDWLVAMNEGKILATGSPEDLRAKTGAQDLDTAFIRLLPEHKRAGHKTLVLPPRKVASQDAAAIEARDLTKRFGDFTAVDHVNFRIEQGEIFGFLGSNGCGKTTTMKMLTGLLPWTEGESWLFGKRTDVHDLETRKRVGYMSQSFSLYGELTVRHNLELHAHLFGIHGDSIPGRVAELLETFGLNEYAADLAEALPLGIRQRLSLAVAVVHGPEILILDEPTSGVDPVTRDRFWQLLIDLSRNKGVTIFISTHFMNEGERCDRISLMHAGRVLVTDTPAALIETKKTASLEGAFIAYLEVATLESEDEESLAKADDIQLGEPERHKTQPGAFSLVRLFGYARRERLELRRDPIRLLVALLGSALLMLILGFGITMDIEDLRFAVLDLDQTPASRDYINNISSSRYFIEHEPIHDDAELERRMRSAELSLAIVIPPSFGRDLKRGRTPEVGVWIDGAMPFRGETIRGYLQGIHYYYLADLYLRTYGVESSAVPLDIQVRYRYNQDYKSLYAMVPAVIALLLVFIPAILMAVSVVREKELGSITNLYVTPVTRLEFLLGKQLPYIVISMMSYLGLVAMAVGFFDVPLKSSFWVLSAAALLYVTATTGLGLLMSSFTRTQIAALAGTGIITILPAVSFSGMTDPVSSLEGVGAIIGQMYPTTYFLVVSRGIFSKALEFNDLVREFIALAAFIPAYTLLSILLLRKQDK